MAIVEQTTIQISRNTRRRLDELKLYNREPMDSVIERLTKTAMDDEPLSEEDIEGIKRGLADIQAGRVHTLESVKKDLGIK
jgi:predicted transcriptional regulator